MTVAETIYNAIKIRKIDYVFCVPGESFLATIDSFYGSIKPMLISTRHEEGAGIMAEAYAKASAKTGVCMVTRGPGITHLSIALHTAKQDSTPLVVFVGQVPTHFRYREAFQELDIVEHVRPISKWAVEINRADRVHEIVDRAFHIANTGRPGPTVISLPEDIDRSVNSNNSEWRKNFAVKKPTLTTRDAELAANIIKNAEFPCIIAGEGVIRDKATEQLVKFAEILEAPVYTSWRRFDAFPNKHDLYMGGIHLSSKIIDLSEPLKNADLIIALGTRLDEFTTLGYSSPSKKQKLIHIDMSFEDTGGTWIGADLAVLADTFEALIRIEKALQNLKFKRQSKLRRKQLAVWHEHFLRRTTPRVDKIVLEKKSINLEVLYHEIISILDEDASITCDAGDFGGWLVRYYKWNKPRTFFGPTSGAMGYALPAAIAAKLARPQFPSIAFVGDGGFAMTMSEIETAVRINIKSLVVLVFNNNSYGTINRHQKREFPGRSVGTDLSKIDFASIAEAMGAVGFKVKKNSDFAKAFIAALNAGAPAVIDIKIGDDCADPWNYDN